MNRDESFEIIRRVRKGGCMLEGDELKKFIDSEVDSVIENLERQIPVSFTPFDRELLLSYHITIGPS